MYKLWARGSQRSGHILGITHASHLQSYCYPEDSAVLSAIIGARIVFLLSIGPLEWLFGAEVYNGCSALGSSVKVVRTDGEVLNSFIVH